MKKLSSEQPARDRMRVTRQRLASRRTVSESVTVATPTVRHNPLILPAPRRKDSILDMLMGFGQMMSYPLMYPFRALGRGRLFR